CTHAVLERTDIKEGDIVLVFGPGPIGNFTAQIAKARGGCVILAGMSKNKKRLELAKTLGIDYVVNIEEENLEEIVRKLTNNYGVNIVFECSGSIHATNSGLNLLKKKGVLVQVGIFAKSLNELDQEKIIQKEIQYIGTRSQKPTSWDLALRLLDTGKVNAKVLVSDIYKLEDWRTGFDKVMNGEGLKIVIES
ncbi:MAG TPA: zinc-binding dehydrogenase, partial [Clostridium sp.]